MGKSLPTMRLHSIVLLSLVKILRLNTSGFTFELTQVVKTATANFTFGDEFNALDEGGVQGEDTLYTNAVRDFTNGKGAVGAAFLEADNVTMENLDTFFFAFNNTHVNFHVVASSKAGVIHAQVLLFNSLDFIHCFLRCRYRYK